MARVCVAALAIGAIEAWRLLGVAPAVSTLVVAIGLTVLGGIVVGLPLYGVGAAVLRIPPIARWRARAAETGAARVGALVELAIAILGLVALWVVAQGAAAWALFHFNARGATAVLLATALTGAAIGIAATTTLAAPPLARLVARPAVLHRWTAGWRGGAVLATLLLSLAIGVTLVVARAAPAYDPRPARMEAGFVLALALAAGLGIERRLRRPGALGAIGAAVLLALSSLVVIGRADVARSAVAGRGTTSVTVLRALWHLTDGDGDGYAGRFGGGDCDDDHAAISPGALEIVDNGKDDNCGGGDVTTAQLAPRTTEVPPRDPAAPRRNVILLTIDTLRADHLGAYGYARPTSPRIDALAARGAVFEWAISPSPITRRAVPALMTGRYASTIGFKDGSWPPKMIAGRHRVLGEVFKKAGYRTHAILCCDDLFDKASGVIAGIDQVDMDAAKQTGKPGDVVAAHVREFLNGSARAAPAGSQSSDVGASAPGDAAAPFFLWVHLFDPHHPYVAHAGTSFGKNGLDRYDGEIAFVDAQVGVILDALDRSGLAASTIVALTSDHGEGFDEHGVSHHGNSLYAEAVRVPLIVRAPDASPQRIAGPVSMIDVGPTLLDLVGLPRPAGQNARSLAGSVRTGEPPPDRMVLAELIADRQIGRSLRAGYLGRWKIVWDLDASTRALYAYTSDPLDGDDVYADHASDAVAMTRALAEASDLELTLLPGEKPIAKEKPKPKPKKPKPAPKP